MPPFFLPPGAEGAAGAFSFVPAPPAARQAPPQPPRTPPASSSATVSYPPLHPRFLEGAVVGHGTFATAVALTEYGTGLQFCTKRLPKARPGRPASTTRRVIENEIAVLRALQGCPQVVRLHQVCEDEAHIHLVLELCQGGTLQDLLQARGALPELQAAHVLRQLLQAMEAAHTQGTCYGDCKPANLLLRQPALPASLPDIAVADWGAAWQQPAGPLRRGGSRGTPLYAAPEGAPGRYGAGLEQDLWAAGVMLHKMLSGCFPFVEPHELRGPKAISQGVYWWRVMHAPLCMDAPAWLGVSSPAKQVVAQLLERDVHSRLTAAEALQHPWVADYSGSGSSTAAAHSGPAACS